MTTNTTAPAAQLVDETIAKLTAKGRETMTAVGNWNGSFFDEGCVVGSGIWGECFMNESGHKSTGVINRLGDLGLFTMTVDDDGTWYALTELGVAVAQQLNAEPTVAEMSSEDVAEQVAAGVAEAKSSKKAKSKAEPKKPAAKKPAVFELYSKKARSTGLVVRVVNTLHKSSTLPTEAGQPWAVICEHDTIATYSARRAARNAMSQPETWCRKCKTVAAKRAAESDES